MYLNGIESYLEVIDGDNLHVGMKVGLVSFGCAEVQFGGHCHNPWVCLDFFQWQSASRRLLEEFSDEISST